MLALAGVVRDHEGTTLELLPNLDFSDATIDLLVDFSLAGGRPVNWNVLTILGSGDEGQAFIGAAAAAREFELTGTVPALVQSALGVKSPAAFERSIRFLVPAPSWGRRSSSSGIAKLIAANA